MAQAAALSSPADILLYGGAAGGGKSEVLLVDAAQYISNPEHHAILFRETFPELEKSLIMRSREMYSPGGVLGINGKYNEQKKLWSFPSGATIEFGHAARDAEIYQYQGAQYSYIGFDEATHFTEFRIRYMISRLRCKDPTIKLKLRLATNPGGEGHNWIMNMFMGSTCIHCMPTEESKVAFKIYNDAKWFSDGEPVGMTSCFIPAKVSDHNIFGEGGVRYVEKLKSLSRNYQKALLEGCWALFEGQYFRCWEMPRMVVPSNCLYRENDRGETFEHYESTKGKAITAQYWWPHWVSIDWGFSHNAAAILYTKAPNGITYALSEIAVQRKTPVELALMLESMWYREGFGSPAILATYLSPDAWHKRTSESTIASQMGEASTLIYNTLIPASDDRIGGAMMIYTQLDTDKLKITSACPLLISTIPSRIHDDPPRSEDIKKTDDVYDDIGDSFRYGVYSHQQNAEKPRSLRIQEEMASVKDPTQAMIRRAVLEHKFRTEDEPIEYMSRRYRSGAN